MVLSLLKRLSGTESPEEPKALFLVLCSNKKNVKLEPYQSGIDSMAGWFPTKHDVLLEHRRLVFDLVSSNETGEEIRVAAGSRSLCGMWFQRETRIRPHHPVVEGWQ